MLITIPVEFGNLNLDGHKKENIISVTTKVSIQPIHNAKKWVGLRTIQRGL